MSKLSLILSSVKVRALIFGYVVASTISVLYLKLYGY